MKTFVSILLLFVGFSAFAEDECFYVKGNSEIAFPPLNSDPEAEGMTLLQRGKFGGYTVELATGQAMMVLTALKNGREVASSMVEAGESRIHLSVGKLQFFCNLDPDGE